MSDLYRTTSTDRTVVEDVTRPRGAWGRRVASEDPVERPPHLPTAQLLAGAAVLGPQAVPLAEAGEGRRRNVAETRNGAGRDAAA